MITYYGHCMAQFTPKEMISYYKFSFLYSCTDPFEIDTGYRDEVCSWYPDGLDKRSYLEIDSMSALVGKEIWADTKMINESSDGNAVPARDCVLRYCLIHYDSKDMDKMAKGFVRRMKKINSIDWHNY